MPFLTYGKDSLSVAREWDCKLYETFLYKTFLYKTFLYSTFKFQFWVMSKAFDFGKIAEGFYFTNREKEAAWLKRQIESGINCMLISPRRWGKSSLVKQVADNLKKDNPGFVFCFVDLFNIRSEQEFYESISLQVLKATNNSLEEIRKTVGGFFKQLIPKISFSPDPSTDIGISFRSDEIKKHYSEILNLPEKIAQKKKFNIIICIDEFQNLGFFDEPLAIQKRLRAHWQKHHKVNYLLYGSKRHLLMDFFTKPSMPFYKFGEILFLEKIEERHWIPFIVGRFRDTGKQIGADLAKQIADMMKNHPYFVQQLAQAVWNSTIKKCTPETIEVAIEDLLTQYTILYQREVDQLTNLQIRFLQGLCKGETLFSSSAFLKKYSIGAPGNIKRIKEALENKEIIDITGKEISLTDPLFELWLNRRYFLNTVHEE